MGHSHNMHPVVLWDGKATSPSHSAVTRKTLEKSVIRKKKNHPTSISSEDLRTKERPGGAQERKGDVETKHRVAFWMGSSNRKSGEAGSDIGFPLWAKAPGYTKCRQRETK